MTTASADREVLREWRDTHEDVRPARDGQTCVHSVWVGERWAGRCGRPAQWVINYGLRVPSLGRRGVGRTASRTRCRSSASGRTSSRRRRSPRER